MRRVQEAVTTVVINRMRRGGFNLTIPNASVVTSKVFTKEDVYQFENFFNPKQFAEFYEAVEDAEEYGKGSFEIRGIAPNELAIDIARVIESKKEKENKIMRKAEKKEEGFVITIEEDVRIPDTDIILEKGEEIRVYPAKVEEAEDKDKKKDDKEKIDKIKAKVEKGIDLTDEEQKILDDAKKADKEKKDDKD